MRLHDWPDLRSPPQSARLSFSQIESAMAIGDEIQWETD
jgi:hypothetical protein